MLPPQRRLAAIEKSKAGRHLHCWPLSGLLASPAWKCILPEPSNSGSPPAEPGVYLMKIIYTIDLVKAGHTGRTSYLAALRPCPIHIGLRPVALRAILSNGLPFSGSSKSKYIEAYYLTSGISAFMDLHQENGLIFVNRFT